MKVQNLASILLYMAVLIHLIGMSGWVATHLLQAIQLVTLALMLTALLVLRKKKRKVNRRPRKLPVEAKPLLERAEEGKERKL